jgi:hypothetical protein
MSQKDEIKKALALAAEGKRTQARADLLKLDPQIKDPHIRLQFIDAAISVLSPVEDNLKILALLMEGIKITSALQLHDLRAYFLGRIADSSMHQVVIRRYRMSMLKLAPRWTEFATEAEKRDYETLSAEVQTLENGIDSSLADAIKISTQTGNKRVQGLVLMTKASIESSRYLQYKTTCMHGGLRAKLWSRYEFMRYPLTEYVLLISNGDARKLNSHVKAFIDSFLRAAALFEELNDPLAATAYHNLANDLKSAYRFRAAKRYLMKGRKIAVRHDDKSMIRQIDEMEKIIAAKNRDIPDYINGETRDLDTR